MIWSVLFFPIEFEKNQKNPFWGRKKKRNSKDFSNSSQSFQTRKEKKVLRFFGQLEENIYNLKNSKFSKKTPWNLISFWKKIYFFRNFLLKIFFWLFQIQKNFFIPPFKVSFIFRVFFQELSGLRKSGEPGISLGWIWWSRKCGRFRK